MTAVLRIIAPVYFFLVATNAVYSERQVGGASAEVAGAVLTADNPARPVRQAVVTLTPLEADSEAGWWERTVGSVPSTLTDDDGRFRLTGLRPGRYRVRAMKPPFLPMEFGATRPGEPGTGVVLADGARIANLSIRLERGAVISGLLRNPDGLPAVGVGVAAATRDRGGVRMAVTTDDRGIYRFFGLPGGEYLISSWLVSSFSPGEQSTSVRVDEVEATLAALERRFSAGGAAGAAATAPARSSSSVAAQGLPALRPLQVAPTYYPGTIDQTLATLINVASAETRDNVDFQLVMAGTVDIAGVVRGPDGGPASGAVVSIGLGRTTTSAQDGTFRLGGVAPGQQTVSARVTAFSAALAAGQSVDVAVARNATSAGTVLWALEDVHVPTTGLSGLEVTLQPGMVLSGRVTFDATSLPAPKDFTSVQVRLIATGVTALPVIREDGSFDVRGLLPGRSQIVGTVGGAAPPGWWLRSAMLGDRDLLDLPLEFSAGTGAVSGVVLTFSDRHTEIAGSLETPQGLPATSYVVAVLPSDRRLWHPQSRRLAFTRPATNGQFSFRDLPPGDYVIVALTDLETETWRNSSFLESIVGAGVSATLTEGGRVVQDLRIAQ